MPDRTSIEISSDMGESFGNYVLGNPEEVMKLINCAYVACGFHAGDPSIMRQTVQWCKDYNVVLGGHPGYPDRLGFGRRYMRITPADAKDYVMYQMGALKNFADSVGIKVRTAKPHGAFFGWATEDEDNAKAVLEGLMSVGTLEAVHLPAWKPNPLHVMVKDAGLRLVQEIYPGLSYASDGTFAITRKYTATPEHEAALVRHWLQTGKVETVDGGEIHLAAECICLHGDLDNALEIIPAVRAAVEAEGLEMKAALA